MELRELYMQQIISVSGINYQMVSWERKEVKMEDCVETSFTIRAFISEGRTV